MAAQPQFPPITPFHLKSLGWLVIDWHVACQPKFNKSWPELYEPYVELFQANGYTGSFAWRGGRGGQGEQPTRRTIALLMMLSNRDIFSDMMISLSAECAWPMRLPADPGTRAMVAAGWQVIRGGFHATRQNFLNDFGSIPNFAINAEDFFGSYGMTNGTGIPATIGFDIIYAPLSDQAEQQLAAYVQAIGVPILDQFAGHLTRSLKGPSDAPGVFFGPKRIDPAAAGGNAAHVANNAN
ncbi:hypothetical protein IAT40_004851 [Kwoniella sp. CBS 6097]